MTSFNRNKKEWLKGRQQGGLVRKITTSFNRGEKDHGKKDRL